MQSSTAPSQASLSALAVSGRCSRGRLLEGAPPAAHHHQATLLLRSSSSQSRAGAGRSFLNFAPLARRGGTRSVERKPPLGRSAQTRRACSSAAGARQPQRVERRGRDRSRSRRICRRRKNWAAGPCGAAPRSGGRAAALPGRLARRAGAAHAGPWGTGALQIEPQGLSVSSLCVRVRVLRHAARFAVCICNTVLCACGSSCSSLFL